MRIGLTYDLRSEYLAAGYTELETAEFDSELTVEAIEQVLCHAGHSTDRIGHARQLVQRLAAGDRWDLVFNICEGLHGLGREAQVPALLDVYQIPYTFSDPLVMALCLHKGLTKTVVRAAGVPTPRFAVIESGADLDQISRHELCFPVFAKPVAEGTSKGVGAASVIQQPDALPNVCSQLLATFHQPVLVEEFLPGREFTVGILGTGSQAQVVGTTEVLFLSGAEQGSYSYLNKQNWRDVLDYRIWNTSTDPVVREAEAVALKAWHALRCRDAGRVDLRCDGAGRPQFIEVNPLAGLNPEYSDLPILCRGCGVSYEVLIGRILESAIRRVATETIP